MINKILNLTRRRISFFLLIALFCSSNTIAQRLKINGIFEGLGNLNILTRQDTVKGYFQNYREDSFSTIFFIIGQHKCNDTYNIKTFYPSEKDSISGILKIFDSSNLEIILNEEPPGREFSIDGTKGDFNLIENKDWINIGYVNTSKVFLFSKPNEKNKTKKFILQNDCVAELQRKGNWVKVECIARKRNVIGWLHINTIKFL